MTLIGASDFVAEAMDDYSAPTASDFGSRIASCRHTVSTLEEYLDVDRNILQKIKKAVKAINASGLAHVDSEDALSQALDKFGNTFVERNEIDLGVAFTSVASCTKEIAAVLKNMICNMTNILVFPLESVLKGDFKEVKGELKKPFDKAWKDYETKFLKIEKEKREQARQHGMIRNEITGAEIAEDLEKERRMFQLQMCEYLIKVNDINTKKGVDIMHSFILYFQTQYNFFQDGLKIMDKFKMYIDKAKTVLESVTQMQDEERNQLCVLRDVLKTAMPRESREESQAKLAGYNLHQLQSNKNFGNEKTGFLLKKSDGIRKVWQRRKCAVKGAYLTISHATANQPPAKLNLLTCQVKPCLDEKKCFDLFSYNRTYHFQAEDELDCLNWIQVLVNGKEEALNKEFFNDSGGGVGGGYVEGSSADDLTKAIILDVQRLPGNNMCCDCSAPDPTWLSTNLGVLTCIECSGIHREMGVHISRIQSLKLDRLGNSELLLAKNVGNTGFNKVMEAELKSTNTAKPTAMSDMEARKGFIMAKYVERRFAQKPEATAQDLRGALVEAVHEKDVLKLLVLSASGVDLSGSLPSTRGQEAGETPLHLAIRLADVSLLHIVDYFAQNCHNMDKQTESGNTALHYCCRHNQTEGLKLLLRSKAHTDIKNADGETALDVARRLNHSQCTELLEQAIAGTFGTRVHVEYNWNLQQDDFDESDDDPDEKVSPVRRERGARPVSCYHCPSQQHLSRERPGSTRERRPPPLHGVDPGSRQLSTLASTAKRVAAEVAAAAAAAAAAASAAGTDYSNGGQQTDVCSAPPLPPRIAGSTIKGPPVPGLPGLAANMVAGSCNSMSRKKPPPPPPASSPGSGHKRTLSEPPGVMPPTPPVRGSSVLRGSNESSPPPPPPVAKPAALCDIGNRQPSPDNKLQAGKRPTIHGLRVLPKMPPSASALRRRSETTGSTESLSQQPPVNPAARPVLPGTVSRTPPLERLGAKPQLPDHPGHKPLAPDPGTKPQSMNHPMPKLIPPDPGTKPHLPDLPGAKPQASESRARLQMPELPLSKPQTPDPGTKPQLPDQRSKPQAADQSLRPQPLALAPKPQLPDPATKPQLAELTPVRPRAPEQSAKPSRWSTESERAANRISRGPDPPMRPQMPPPPPPLQRQQHGKRVSGSTEEVQAMEEQLSPSSPAPLPLPRKTVQRVKTKQRRVKAIYDCTADHPDELTFHEGEVLLVVEEEDADWWIGHVEGEPERTGVFPVSFVHILSD
uniref:Arf-GAP with SH3 domain, ANK repeat and PH domain-containing protein 3 n=1 Tax=Petromyzon marinus TaxID=7757 RepID=A0AAJ7T3X2_PETMA|nr:arf-GAP with SH3 domain, ANK repeat and PH domain-containing protein 1-like [Petromyzon marinus]